MTEPPRRRLGGWGFETESYPAPAPLLGWLTEKLGPVARFSRFDLSRFRPEAPLSLPELRAATSREPRDRLVHARGQGITDLIRLRTGTVPALPDAVVQPGDAREVAAVLQTCARNGVRVIPWGGGTSVTGGVNVSPDERPLVSLDLQHLAGLEALDETSRLATFGAGTLGPDIESALGSEGLTLGHFPQSFELSTLGGWIATRSSGQESLGYGSIESMVAGLELVAPAGRLEVPAFPASAAGPDLRQVALGSEGRLGVVTRATVRIRPRPEKTTIIGALLPSWEGALAAARELVQSRVALTLLRLSDPLETEVTLTLGLRRDRFLDRIVRRFLSLRGATEESCMMLCGASGDASSNDRVLDEARAVLRRAGGIGLGESPGRKWLEDRFRHPYLRDSLLDAGIATDSLETAAPWSQLIALSQTVREALVSALRSEGEPVVVLCHASHPYCDGTSLYFTFFFRCPGDPDEATARWAKLKRRATAAILRGGGTLTHHHGVGSWHAPWFEEEVGEVGKRLVQATAGALDPSGVLSPHVLLDPTDRLEL